MKRIVFSLCALAAVLGASAARINIKGAPAGGQFTLAEFNVGDMRVAFFNRSEPLSTVNGEFDADGAATLSVTADGPRVYALANYGDPEHRPLLLLNPEDDITVTYTAGSVFPAVSGAADAEAIVRAQAFFDKAYGDFVTAAQNPEATDVMRQAAYGSFIAKLIRFIDDNADNAGSVFTLMPLPAQNAAEFVGKLKPEAYAGAIRPIYDDIMKGVEAWQAKEAAKALIAEDKPAPDFTLNNLDGKPVSLRSLRGKFVIIDFWGSWCGWCIKGFPALKEFYAANKDRVEVIGIDCGDTPERWRDAVEKYQLPWIQVRHTDDDNVTAAYAIDGFPTKLLIGPDGIIRNVTVGEDPNFFPTIAKIIADTPAEVSGTYRPSSFTPRH